MPLPFTIWPDYRHFESAIARDLCWLLTPQYDLRIPNSRYPPFQTNRDSKTLAWLRQLDRQHVVLAPNPAAQTTPTGQRLGQYFEDLVAFYLTYAPNTGISDIQRNIPLRRPMSSQNGTETLGELDFLYQQERRWHHLEVAVKFYLGMNDGQHTHWLGPNSKDSLDRKCRRLMTHQLPLAQRLNEYCSQQREIHSSYWLKGILFHHWHQGHSGPGHARFHWIHQHQSQAYFQHYGGQWRWLQKRHWLGTYSADQPALDITQLELALKQHFSNASYGIMLVSSGTADEHRCFIVADQWPL